MPPVLLDYRLDVRTTGLGTIEYVWARRTPVVVGALCVLIAIVGLIFVPELAWLYLTIAIVGLALGSGLLQAAITMWAVRRDRAARAPVHVEIDAAGVRFRTIHAASSVDWAYFRSVRCTRNVLLMVSNSVVMIPRTAVSSDQLGQIERFAGPLFRRG